METKSEKEIKITDMVKRVNREREHLLDLGGAMDMFFFFLFDTLIRRDESQENFGSEEEEEKS